MLTFADYLFLFSFFSKEIENQEIALEINAYGNTSKTSMLNTKAKIISI